MDYGLWTLCFGAKEARDQGGGEGPGVKRPKAGRDETYKPVKKNAIKPKNGLRPKNRGKQKQNTKQGLRAEGLRVTAEPEPKKGMKMDLRTRMMNCFTEVCVGSSNLQFLYFQLSKPAPKPQPSGDLLSGCGGRAASGSIETRGVGGEHATGTCFCIARAVLFFACVRPRAAAKTKKNKENVLYRPD
jgi:hypothetical protein